MGELYDSGGQGANPVDLHVGLRIRQRRQELGISQERLAESLGVTFQQIQKYERAANRISASKLWAVATALNTSVAFFYDGLAPGDEPAESPEGAMRDFLSSPDGRDLATAYRAIRPAVRRRVLDLVRAMAGVRGPA